MELGVATKGQAPPIESVHARFCQIWDLVEGLESRRESSTTSFLHLTAMPLLEYLERLQQWMGCSSVCCIIALVLLQRFRTQLEHPGTAEQNHRSWLTALIVAIKFHDDSFYSFKYYSKVGGVPLSELIALEVEFLRTIHFDIFVSGTKFEKELEQVYYNS